MSTISEALAWQKVLATRRAELIKLRDGSAKREFRAVAYGAEALPGTVVEPTYDVKALDKVVAAVSREERLVSVAIKRANATTEINYEINDKVLGELV
jgi:hypothetical protein